VGSIKAITPPFIGDYVGLVADATSAYAVRVTEPDPARMPRPRGTDLRKAEQ